MSKTFNIYCDESTYWGPDRHLYMLFICSAYYLNKEYGKRALIKKMGRRLPNVL